MNESGNLRIEKVDFIMSAQEIGSVEELKGKCNYILSSHNLEHIPNPILFLKGWPASFKARWDYQHGFSGLQVLLEI